MKDEAERRATLVELLDHWHDFFDEPSPEGSGGDGDPNKPMPADWTLFSSQARWPSVREMRRLLDLLGVLGKGHQAHLVAYTVNVSWRTTDGIVKVKNAHGKWVLKEQRVRQRVVPRWVSMRIVERSLDFMLGQWDQAVPLELPPCLTMRLRPLADSDGWTEAA